MDLFEWAATPGAKVLLAPRGNRPTPKASEKKQAAPAPLPAPLQDRGPFQGVQIAPLLTPLRDYQEDFRHKTHEHFKTEDRGLGVAGTGAGKTIFFSALAADYAPAHVIILTDQFDLVDQAVEKLLFVTGIIAAVEQGERTGNLSAQVVVATVQSLATRLDKYPPDHFALVVCDEADRSIAPIWKKVLAHFDGHAKVLGVTATPNRADRKNILDYFKTKVFEIGIMELIDRGFLTPVVVQTLPIKIDLSAAEKQEGKDFDPEETAKACKKVYTEIARAIQTHARGRKVLVFNPDCQSSKEFVLACHRVGLNARHIDGESRDRAEIKKDFREGKFQVLSNPLMLSRGYDEPGVDCIVNLRITNSEALYWQMIGRGTRLYCPHGCGGPCNHPERKRELLILDFLYQFKQKGPVRPASLFADSPAKAAAMVRVMEATQGKLDLREAEKLAALAMQVAFLAAMMEAQKVHGGKKGEYFKASDFAANLRIPDLLDYVPETEAEAMQPDARLLKKIAAAGLIPETVYCQGQAVKMLSALEARKQAGLASMKQVFWLRKWGYKDPENITADRAKSISFKEFKKSGKF